MRLAVRCFVAAALSGVAACQGGTPLGPGAVVRAADAAAQSPGGGPVNGDPTKTLVPDAGTEAEMPTVVMPVPPPAPVGSCADLASGGTPSSLDSFLWEHQIRAGDSSYDWDFVWIEKGCMLRYQHDNRQRQVMMPPADCAAARAWATNTALLEVVRTGGGCPDGKGNPNEVFEVGLATGGGVGRKFFDCSASPLPTVRACLQPLVDRLFGP